MGPAQLERVPLQPLKPTAPDSTPPSELRLALVSAAALFLELLLIRWLGTEVRIFAYLQNTVLVVCFLGLGTGCFRPRRELPLLQVLLPLAALVALVCLPGLGGLTARISGLLDPVAEGFSWSSPGQRRAWGTDLGVVAGLLLTVLLLGLVFLCFLPLGRLLGGLLGEHPRPLRAYSINVAASLAGTWLMVALSALWLAPWVWLVTLGLLLSPFLARSPRARAVELACLVALALLPALQGAPAGALLTVWSPYQKLTFIRPPGAPEGVFLIEVNGTGYQTLLDLDPKRRAADPEDPRAPRGYGQYDLPMRLHPTSRRVLVVGSGAGNDVAGMLRQGAQDTTAVDIDPAIIDLGRRWHAERPYARAEVRVVVDDARAFFARTPERYDLISFGLLDSHTTPSLANTRLDHFVYTRESLVQARALLTEGGVLVLSFQPNHPFIAERLRATLTEAFGQPPLVFAQAPGPLGWGGVLYVCGDLSGVRARLEADPRLAAVVRGGALIPGEPTRSSTDDWPYLYLPGPTVPTLHALLAGLLALLFLASRRWLGAESGRWDRERIHFCALGAAFLLLEVVSITKASVALGSTWWVSAVVISGVLVMVLLANAWVATRPRASPHAAFTALLLACAGVWAFDLAWLTAFPFAARVALVGVITTGPLLFSGVVFARGFAGSAARPQALGANLLGALLGGVLQALSYQVGLRALLLLVGAFYLVAWLTAPRPGAERSLALTAPLP